MNIQVTEIQPRVILLKFESQYEIASTMMMLQEYYESPYDNVFRKIVSYEEYMETYAKDTGNFTYFTDWSGFNIPGNIVRDYIVFKSLVEDYIWNKEKQLFEIIKPYVQKYGEDFYVLAIYKETDIKHELAHAIYYLHKEYKERINKVINKRLKYFKDKKKKLLKMGYRIDMIDDEQQAYFLEAKLSNESTRLIGLQKKATKIFQEYTK